MVKCSKASCKQDASFVCSCYGEKKYFCDFHLASHLKDTSIKHNQMPLSAIFDKEVTKLVLSSLNSIKSDIRQKKVKIIEDLSRTIILLENRIRLILDEMSKNEELLEKTIAKVQLHPEELDNNLGRILKMNLDLARKECKSWKPIKLNLNSEELRNSIGKWCKIESEFGYLVQNNQKQEGYKYMSYNTVENNYKKSSPLCDQFTSRDSLLDNTYLIDECVNDTKSPFLNRGHAKLETNIVDKSNLRKKNITPIHGTLKNLGVSKITQVDKSIGDHAKILNSKLTRRIQTPTNPRESISQGLKYVFSQETFTRPRKSIAQGISNLDNTDFMDSILQCIVHFNSFVEFFENTTLKSNYLRSLQDLILGMRSHLDTSYYARIFQEEFSLLKVFHQDSKEFYCSILAALISDSPSIKEICILQKSETYTFQGCICTNRVATDYPFIPLSVSSLGDWKSDLQEFLREQRTCDSYYCIRCKVKRNGYIETVFKFPEVLAIYFHQSTNVELGDRVVIDNTQAKSLASKSRLKDPSYPLGKYIKSEDRRSTGQRVEYTAESCILLSEGNAHIPGHFSAMTLEGNQGAGYVDSSFSANSEMNCSAYMLFLAIK